MKVTCIQRWRFLASLLVVGLLHRLSPWARGQEITWLKLNGLPQVSSGVEVESTREENRLSGTTSTYETMFVTPTIGLKTGGYVYHPNLLTFDANGELGWGFDRLSTSGPGYAQDVNESSKLLRYYADVNLLQEKDYNASFFAAQDHTYQDYGAFETFTVDSTRYGGRINWSEDDTLNVNTDFGYRDETDSGLLDTSEVRETYINFVGLNRRKTGQTTLTARWDLFDNIVNFGNQLTTMNESVGIADSETFGQRQQVTVATGATVTHSEYSNDHMDTVNATENINVHHTRTLDSFLLVNFDDNQQNAGTQTLIQGQYGLRHQLYESLTSTLDVHGDEQDNSFSAGSNGSDLYGVGLSENYTKRLQTWGRLTIGASVIGNHQDDTAATSTVNVAAESHQLYLPTSSLYRPVYLNNPRVISVSLVTAGGQQLSLGTDYELVRSGQLTEIQLISPVSSHLQALLGASDNLTVAVTYQSDSGNNASYEDLTSDAQIRLELFDCLGLYGRLNWTDNNAPPTVTTETITDLVGGMDFKWRWFRTGAEYENFDSNFTAYDAWRFFQNFDYQVNYRSTASVDFNESFYHYGASGDQSRYQLAVRYNVQLWASLSCYVQGGCAFEESLGTDQTMGSAQAGLDWTYGKFSARTGFEYNDQTTGSGSFAAEFERYRIFLFLKRSF